MNFKICIETAKGWLLFQMLWSVCTVALDSKTMRFERICSSNKLETIYNRKFRMEITLFISKINSSNPTYYNAQSKKLCH